VARGHPWCERDLYGRARARLAPLKECISAGLEVGEDFFAALGDGVLLCSIINTIKPGTIPKVREEQQKLS
jgi:hypothetical protein